MGSDIPKYRQLQAQRKNERLLLLGRITQDWNLLEYYVAKLTSLYTLDEEAGYLIAARLRNIDATDVLLQLVRDREQRKRVISAIDFAVAAFHRLRENRNMLVHSDSALEITGHHVLWGRRSKTNPNNIVSTLGSTRDLKKVAADIDRLRQFFGDLIWFTLYESTEHMAENDEFLRETLKNFERPSLPRRFPLPRKLKDGPPLGRQRAARPPQASRR